MSEIETNTEKKKRSWMPLLSVVGFVLLLSLFLMPWFVRGLNQKSAASAVKDAGGLAMYGRSLSDDASYVTNTKKGGEKSVIGDLMGEAFVEQLTEVQISQPLANRSVIKKLSKLRSLEIVDLGGTKIGDEDLRHLSKSFTIRKLWINGSEVTDDGLKQLSSIPDLVSLSLDETKISDAAMESVAAHQGLKRLYMDKTQIGDAGVGRLSGLTELMGIGLQGTDVTDNVVTHLMKMHSLEEVRLGDTVLTDAGVAKLSSLPKLKSLNLENTNVGESGLSWLQDCETLEIIDLSGTNVSDEITKILAKMPKLITVYLHRTSVSREAWDGLRKELGSGVQVQHSAYSEKAEINE